MLIGVTIVSSALLSASGLVAAVTGSGQAPQPTTAFGFEPKEVRRYVLGPADKLAPGELADWSLRFEQFEESGDQTLALFTFTHDRLERLEGTFNSRSQLLSVAVEGSLRTNLAGFPLLVQYTQRFAFDGDETQDSGRRTITFAYDDESRRYTKTIKVGNNDWDFKVAVPKHKHLDLDTPRGLYMYLPGALGCLGDSRVECVEREPALGNPGFLSLALPALEELEDAEKAEREFLFLMPVGLSASPFLPVSTGRWMSHERDRLSNIKRYFEFAKLQLKASEQITVGPRTMHAWEVDMCCGIDQAWVEPGGRVLRVDLEPTVFNPEERSIRYVFPSEEFLTPNADPELKCCDSQ